MMALTVEQLCVLYDRAPVLWDIHFSIPQGKMVGILGPNGAGKSTLIKALLGLTTSLSGKVELLGKSYKQVRKLVAYVPQRNSVDWEFPITVQEVVSMGCYGRKGLFQRLGALEKKKVQDALAQVGLESLADRQIGELSGGQQQKTFLARALVQQADLYFLDEPFMGVDMTTEKTIMRILQELASQGKTLCIVHHDLHCIREYFDWIVLLNTTLIASGSVEDVFCKNNLLKAYGDHLLFSEFS